MNGTPLSTDFRLLNTDSALIDRLIISPSLVLSAIHVVHSVVYVNSVSHCISLLPVAIFSAFSFYLRLFCTVFVRCHPAPVISFHVIWDSFCTRELGEGWKNRGGSGTS